MTPIQLGQTPPSAATVETPGMLARTVRVLDSRHFRPGIDGGGMKNTMLFFTVMPAGSRQLVPGMH